MNAPESLQKLKAAAQHPHGHAGAHGRELPHESAELHVSGAARFTDDLPELQGTLYAALVTSPVAHGRLLGPDQGVDKQALLAEHGVVAVFTADDIPGENNCGPIVHDDPFLADRELRYLGQPVAVVVAREIGYARAAARKAKLNVEQLEPVLTIEQALAAGSFVMPSKTLQRGDPAVALAAAPHRLKGSTRTGQQEQFYLEGHITYAVPREDGQLTLYCSTQHPDGNQREAAAALELATADVEVICRRMGGGFGGKEGNASIFSQSAALAAHKLQRPVKLRVDRDDDMRITGKRHDFKIDWEVGFDDAGRILAFDVTLASRCGHSTDYSGPVNDRAMLHVDNCYHLPNLKVTSHRCRTNTQSSTAFRGFGGPQGMFAIENALDDVARHLGLDPLDVRLRNLYREPAAGEGAETITTHYGQRIEDFVADRILAELEADADYRERRAAVQAFNAAHRAAKRGLAIVPLKFGISFTATLLNQAGALVNLYADGSVVVNHGGTEMGQGLNTKIAQIAAEALGIDVERVRVTATDTQKVPNASATAASSGCDLNGAATLDACLKLRQRLAEVAAQDFGCRPDEITFGANHAHGPEDRNIGFRSLANKAWASRVSLSQAGHYATPKIGYDPLRLQGRPFLYYSYGASVSEVELDCLTGEWRLLRADLLHDVGASINPAIDRGQVEGGYIQGMGWLTMEECLWDGAGRLLTHGPSTYKIPVAGDVPEAFHVRLLDNRNVEPTVHRSKATGEPPLMLGLSAFFALRDAVGACGDTRAPVPLVAPATPERLLLAADAVRAAARRR